MALQKYLSQLDNEQVAFYLKLQVKKCVFGKDTVRFLGHIISSAGITTDPEKISRVAEWPIPVNRQELNSS